MAISQNLIQMQNGSKAFGGQRLFSEATFSLNSGEHVGVIGPNGAGKSTLFRILIQEEVLDAGQVIRSRELVPGYLSQHDHWKDQETGNQYLDRITKIPLWQAKSRGRDLQVSEDMLNRPILSLSGGYRMRIKLIGLLSQDPNLMLLDEPTNYLDLETTLLLEKFLQNFEGAFLLISHDREFLRRTTDHILEIEAGDITKFNGNIDDYFEQKALLSTQLEARAQTMAEKRKSILDFVSRFGAKASKARQAQSKLRTLEKMEVIEIKPVPMSANLPIPEPPHVGKSVLKLEAASVGYADRNVLQKVSINIERGDHVAVVGLNGVGKSTLLKTLAGTLPLQEGTRHVGYQVKVAIFNQHVAEALQPGKTIIECFEGVAHPDVSRQEMLNLAGSLLFSGDNMRKKVDVLSGGEKSRIALGQILLQKAPCLLLDEPTNHLDFQTVEALTQALVRYTGTFVVVSHDRGFIGRISSKILEISSGNVRSYPGTYDEYVWSLQKTLAAEEAMSETSPHATDAEFPRATAQKSTENKVSRKELDRKIKQIEKQIQNCEQDLHLKENENQRLNFEIVNGAKNSQDITKKMAENLSAIEAIESKWLELSESLQMLKNSL